MRPNRILGVFGQVPNACVTLSASVYFVMQENNFVVSLDSPVMRWIKQPSFLVSVTERNFYVRNMENIETEMQVVHFEKICRLCLREEDSLTQIFDSNSKDICSSIDRKIMACSSIEVSLFTIISIFCQSIHKLGR